MRIENTVSIYPAERSRQRGARFESDDLDGTNGCSQAVPPLSQTETALGHAQHTRKK